MRALQRVVHQLAGAAYGAGDQAAALRALRPAVALHLRPECAQLPAHRPQRLGVLSRGTHSRRLSRA